MGSSPTGRATLFFRLCFSAEKARHHRRVSKAIFPKGSQKNQLDATSTSSLTKKEPLKGEEKEAELLLDAEWCGDSKMLLLLCFSLRFSAGTGKQPGGTEVTFGAAAAGALDDRRVGSLRRLDGEADAER